MLYMDLINSSTALDSYFCMMTDCGVIDYDPEASQGESCPRDTDSRNGW
jgi:hypothetical protein